MTTEPNQQENPLLKFSTLPYGAVPFDLVKNEHFLVAVDSAIAEAREKIAKIKSEAQPSFVNTIEALETASDKLGYVSAIFYNLFSAETNDTLQSLAKEIGPKTSAFSNDILLDHDLFQRIHQVYETRQSLNLKGEQAKLLEKTYRDFVRNGALLNTEQKDRLRAIDEETAKLGPVYSEHVLKSTNAFTLEITSKEDLKGLPESVVEAAAHTAEEQGKKGVWVFNLQGPSYIPFLTYAENRGLREKMWRAFATRAFQGEFDNSKLCIRLAELRHQRAQILGYKTHAHFTLEERMAEAPEKVLHFLERIAVKAKPAALRDIEEVKALKKELSGDAELMPWDYAFYSEKLKMKKYDFNEEDLRPYFKLENVIDGVFEHARKLYGLIFSPTTEVPVYHPDVLAYKVTQESNNEFVGLFYADFFPRPSKRSGAWMTNYREQGLHQGQVERPHVSIVCNFTKPTPTKPSLLSLDEVKTTFHEFGHALHSLLSNCHYVSLAGTNVFWDFVELPSQVMENWVNEKESLDLFAHHYETHEAIPKELAEKIKKTHQFQSGYTSMRQLSFGLLDMAWHSQDPSLIKDIEKFEAGSTESARLLPRIAGTSVSTSFSHIFAGGYSAGYYSYKWAEVLDADAFEYFKEKGLFNKEVAKLFRENVLSRGGTEHPMELYKKFRGREPDPDALLRREGLL